MNLFRWFLILNGLYGRPALADSLLPACQHALSACDQAVKAQAQEIQGLKESLAEYRKAVRAGDGPSGPSLGVAMATGALGGAAGGAMYGGREGALVGGASGLLVGGVIGLILGR